MRAQVTEGLPARPSAGLGGEQLGGDSAAGQVSPKHACCNSSPHGTVRRRGFGQRPGREGEALTNGFNSVMEEPPELPHPSPFEVSRKQVLARHRIYWHLDLELPASRAVRNAILLLPATSLGCFC